MMLAKVRCAPLNTPEPPIYTFHVLPLSLALLTPHRRRLRRLGGVYRVQYRQAGSRFI
jgi:hypothetical protein